MTVGESVSDASTQNVIVQGAGGLEATTTVGVDDVAKVKVGQRAYVTPDGSSKVLEGSVAAISAAPTSSDSTDYRVTIALDDPDDVDRQRQRRHRHHRHRTERFRARGSDIGDQHMSATSIS